MTSSADPAATRPGLLDRQRIVAGPGFNRWLISPAALAIHLSIGMAYGFSVFWLPLSRAVGVRAPLVCSEAGFWTLVTSRTCDWPVSMLSWTYTLFFIFLGSSAALFGRWIETAGPRKAGVAAALCWSGGLLLAACGVYLHQIWLLWLGAGVIGGIGLGLGYLSPVSTLIRWFPDKRGLASGMAVMGFGGGAMIGAPLANRLMNYFADATSVGVWQTFALLGCVYFFVMLLGAFGYRLPAAGWAPPGLKSNERSRLNAARDVTVAEAVRTRQFWLLWAVLCLNISAGIAVIGMASPMLQEVFGGRLIGLAQPLADLTDAQRATIASIGAGFAGLLSLFNIAGRIAWASFSDIIGRKLTYCVFFLAGSALYVGIATAGGAGHVGLFVGLCCLAVTLYGGGFATMPAYLADQFGPQHVGAIQGRLLTAWSVAGILGPGAVNYIRELQLQHGVPPQQAYAVTMFVLAGLLLVGLLCNLLVRPLHAQQAKSEASADPPAAGVVHLPTPLVAASIPQPVPNQRMLLVLAWSAALLPLGWGLWITFTKTLVLFAAP